MGCALLSCGLFLLCHRTVPRVPAHCRVRTAGWDCYSFWEIKAPSLATGSSRKQAGQANKPVGTVSTTKSAMEGGTRAPCLPVAGTWREEDPGVEVAWTGWKGGLHLWLCGLLPLGWTRAVRSAEFICPSQNERRMSANLVYLGMVGMVDLRVCSCPGPRRPPHLGIGDPTSVTSRMKATAQASEENS